MQSTVIFEHWEILLKWRVKIRTGKLVSNERKDVIPNRRRTGYLIKERKGYNKGEKSVSEERNDTIQNKRKEGISNERKKNDTTRETNFVSKKERRRYKIGKTGFLIKERKRNT